MKKNNRKKLKFIKRSFLKNLILVTGTHTSGKSMVSPVIASLNNVEILRKIYLLDQIAILNSFSKIDNYISTFISKHILDFSFYEQLIGRNLNFRYEDETGIYQSKNHKIFKKRIYIKRGKKVLEKHLKKNTHMLVDTHDGMWFYDFWKRLNINNLKIISVFRNPIDVVNSWINLDLGKIENEVLCQIPLIQKSGIKKPFYYFKSFEKKINKYEAIIEMVSTCVNKDIDSYNSIKNKKNIYRVDFQDFAENTNKNLKKICKFLNLNKSKYTFKILKKENLPRTVNKIERENKLKKIKKKVKKIYLYKLLNLEKKYLKHKRLIEN